MMKFREIFKQTSYMLYRSAILSTTHLFCPLYSCIKCSSVNVFYEFKPVTGCSPYTASTDQEEKYVKYGFGPKSMEITEDADNYIKKSYIYIYCNLRQMLLR